MIKIKKLYYLMILSLIINTSCAFGIDKQLEKHFESYCYKCHSKKKSNGDINLE